MNENVALRNDAAPGDGCLMITAIGAVVLIALAVLLGVLAL
jgi:hypothetical protein